MTEHHSIFQRENYYHIFNRGNNREVLFKNAGNYQYFLEKWRKYIRPYAHILAYCLMPNHFHFLIKIKSENDMNFTNPERLSKALKLQSTKTLGISRFDTDINKLLENQFRKLFSSYTLAFNKQQNRTGSLFQKRFKRIQISSDEYLTRIIHYIHHNPIHHGFMQEYSKWRYSSYNTILSEKASLLSRTEVLSWFGGKEEFIKYHTQNINRNFDEI